MGKRVHVRPPQRIDQKAFIAHARASRHLHGGWVQAPQTPAAFAAYVGYYAFAPLAGDGYMTEGFSLALDYAFRNLALHRVEANVQPANRRSLALVTRVGFEREGYSRRYVKIGGRWRDHVRFALLAEDWPKRRAALRRSLAAMFRR